MACSTLPSHPMSCIEATRSISDAILSCPSNAGSCSETDPRFESSPISPICAFGSESSIHASFSLASSFHSSQYHGWTPYDSVARASAAGTSHSGTLAVHETNCFSIPKSL